MISSIFITATDTGVGKTTISCGIAALLRHRGRRVGVMKPVETGGSADTEQLIQAAGVSDPVHTVCPYLFKNPVSPHQAAEEENRRIEPQKIIERYKELKAKYEFVIVEGAGGLLVPLTGKYLVIDLIKELETPVLLVASARVGTINHILLSCNALKASRIETVGAIINHRQPPQPHHSLPSEFTRFTDVPLLGTVPFLGDSPNPERIASALKAHIRLDWLK